MRAKVGAGWLELCSLWHPMADNLGPYKKIIDQICSILPWPPEAGVARVPKWCLGCWRHESPRAAWAVALLSRLPGCLELLGLAELLLDAVIAVGCRTR